MVSESIKLLFSEDFCVRSDENSKRFPESRMEEINNKRVSVDMASEPASETENYFIVFFFLSNWFF